MAVAVGVGYLLGRTRKMRLALTLAGIGAGGRLRGGPAGLVQQGSKLLGSSPELKTLGETVRGRLVDAGKTAAVTAASSQIDALSDRLQERTRSLTRPPVPGRAAGEGEKGDEERGGQRDRGAGGPEEEPEEGPAPRRRGEGPESRRGSTDEQGEEVAQTPRPRRRAVPAGERPVRRRRPVAGEAEEERLRRSARAAGRPPVRRIRREES